MQKSPRKLRFLGGHVEIFSFRRFPQDHSGTAERHLARPYAGLELDWALEFGQSLIEIGDGLDASEVVLQQDMLVRGVSIFVGQAEAQ